MNGLAAFYAARLDEDEAAARLAAREGGTWTQDDPGSGAAISSLGGVVVYDEGAPDENQAPHIARHDPARVLREIAAKRAILAEYEEAAEHPFNLPEGVFDGRDDDERADDAYLLRILDGVVRYLAAVYSGHPGYDPGWAPS